MTVSKDFQACREQWFRHNVDKSGREKHGVGRYSYNGPIFYAENTPSQRLMFSEKRGIWVLLARFYNAHIPEAYKQVTQVVVVPDLACFSIFDGDWYAEPEEVHGRQKYIMLLRVVRLLEDTRAMTGKDLSSTYKSDPQFKTLETYYQQWDSYDRAFLLNWGSMPNFYRHQLSEIINTKKAAWQEPTAVMRRERQAARKAAKEALGLNVDK